MVAEAVPGKARFQQLFGGGRRAGRRGCGHQARLIEGVPSGARDCAPMQAGRPGCPGESHLNFCVRVAR
jgi:hypothetical protein